MFSFFSVPLAFYVSWTLCAPQHPNTFSPVSPVSSSRYVAGYLNAILCHILCKEIMKGDPFYLTLIYSSYLTHMSHNCQTHVRRSVTHPSLNHCKKHASCAGVTNPFCAHPLQKQTGRHISPEPGCQNGKSRFLCQAIQETMLLAGTVNIPFRHHQLLNITGTFNTEKAATGFLLLLQDALGHAVLPITCTFHTLGKLEAHFSII